MEFEKIDSETIKRNIEVIIKKEELLNRKDMLVGDKARVEQQLTEINSLLEMLK